jgi:hypothetical protein
MTAGLIQFGGADRCTGAAWNLQRQARVVFGIDHDCHVLKVDLPH